MDLPSEKGPATVLSISLDAPFDLFTSSSISLSDMVGVETHNDLSIKMIQAGFCAERASFISHDTCSHYLAV